MATPAERKTLSHLERTAAEPRDSDLHPVILKRIDQFNDQIRLLRLSPIFPAESFTFLPGQWLDVHVPGVSKPGGFTITSPPHLLLPSNPAPYFELAIQKSPSNPPAAWLWRPEGEILNESLQVRVGGSFVWPPIFYGKEIKRVVFVTGGIGINPLMSIVSHLSKQSLADPLAFDIKFLYTLRDPGEERGGESILFLERLCKCFNLLEKDEALQLFLTRGDKGSGVVDCNENEILYQGRRIEAGDLWEALGPVEERGDTVVYICGLPNMTDDMVKAAKEAEGMDERHVLCEKWW